MHGAEGDVAVIVRSDGDRGGASQIEIGAIPDVGFDDAPASDQRTDRWRALASGLR